VSATRNSLVIDLSHWNRVTDWPTVAKSGVAGVIHKFSQGVSYRDPAYAAARQGAKAAGLLFGRYHFADGTDVKTQVKNFIEGAWGEELLALDWEDNTGGGGTMSLAQAVEFVKQIEVATGQTPVLYGGNRIKEALAGTPNPTLARCRLWLAQYAAAPVCPPGWTKPWLWQWTDKGTTPGVVGAVDQDTFAGLVDDLHAEWTGDAPPVPGPTPPVEATDTISISFTVPTGTQVVIHSTGESKNVILVGK
jgi:lysozyme